MDFSIFSTKVCETKRIHHWLLLGQENPNPRVHRSSGKRGFAEFSTGAVDSRVGILPFPQNTNDRFYFSHTIQFFILPRYIWSCTVHYVNKILFTQQKVTKQKGCESTFYRHFFKTAYKCVISNDFETNKWIIHQNRIIIATFNKKQYVVFSRS